MVHGSRRTNRPHVFRIARQVALHEAGHYVAARVLGFKTGDLELTMQDGGGHHASCDIKLYQPLTDEAAIVDYLERRIVVLTAGAMSETLRNGEFDNQAACDSSNTGGAMNDRAKAREHLQLLRNIQHKTAPSDENEILAQMSVIDQALWKRAGELVVAEYEQIEGIGPALAARMLHLGQRAVLTGAEIDALPAVRARFGL